MANITRTPATATLGITLTDVAFINSTDSKMVITGQPVTLGVQPLKPTTGSASLSGQQVTRAFGLRLAGQGITRIQNLVVLPGVGSLGISSDVVQRVIETPPDEIVAPTTRSISISSDVIAVHVLAITPDTAAMTIAGSVPVPSIDRTIEIIEWEADPLLTIFGRPITISLDFVGGSPGDGTLIQNLDATTDSPNRYTICDRSGFRVKPLKNPLVKDPYGNYVRAESSDVERHPQERVRSMPESQRGSIRPEPVLDADLTFIDADDPVTQDDL